MFDPGRGGGIGFPAQPAASLAASPEGGNNPRDLTERTAEKFIRYYPWMVAFVVFIHVAYLVFLNMHPDIRSANSGRVIDDSFILFGELVILTACIYALRRIQEMERSTREGLIKRARLAILFITASALCNSIGQVFWIWYDGTLAAVPYPAIDDAFFLANYPFFFIGIALLIPRGGSAAGRARVLVDAGTLVLSVVAIFWYFVLGPTLATLSGSALVKGVSLAYPLSDLAASVAAILLYLNPFTSASPRRTLARLTLGIACSAISNMIYGYIQASGAYYTGMFVDAGFPLTWMLIAWAVFTYPSDLEKMLVEQPDQTADRAYLSSRFSAIFRAVLPLLFTLVTCALLVLAVALRGGAPIAQVVLVCGGLFLLPVVRQSLTLIDNIMLNERLRVALNQSQSAFHQSQDKLISTTMRAEQLEQLLSNIENLQSVHASLARGDFSVRAAVQGPLSPVAQSLNLLIERMNRWAQAVQVNRVLTEEADWLYRVLEALGDGNVVLNIPAPHHLLSTSKALLSTRRLQTRLTMRFQKQRETAQLALRRLQAMKNVLMQARNDLQNDTFDRLKTEQFLMEVQKNLLNYEAQLQDFWKQARAYEQRSDPAVPQKSFSGRLER
jgi:hypothetical protein